MPVQTVSRSTDSLIDACVNRAKVLATTAHELEREFFHTPQQPFNTDLLKQKYVQLVRDIEEWKYKLKLPAVQKWKNERTEKGIQLKDKLDSASDFLQSHHQILLRQILNSSYGESKIPFTLLAPSLSPEMLKLFKKEAIDHAGWIATAVMASFAAITLMPELRHFLWGSLKATPRHLPALFNKLEQFYFNNNSLIQYVGHKCAWGALIYPIYRHVKDPLHRLAKATVEKLDTTITTASTSPLKTLAIAGLTSYLALRILGIECVSVKSWTQPYLDVDARIAVSSAVAVATINVAHRLKRWIDRHKYEITAFTFGNTSDSVSEHKYEIAAFPSGNTPDSVGDGLPDHDEPPLLPATQPYLVDPMPSILPVRAVADLSTSSRPAATHPPGDVTPPTPRMNDANTQTTADAATQVIKEKAD